MPQEHVVRSRVLFPVLFTLPLLTGCEFELCTDQEDAPTEAIDTSRDAIIGGSVDEGNRATVALMLTLGTGKRALCSGTVIARDGTRGWVLTAAHCTTGSVDAIYEATDFLDCTGQGDASQCHASYAFTGWTSHPGYDPSVYANDFAIVTFEGATDATTVVPVAGSVDGLAAGQQVELSGYGRTYAGPGDASQPFQTHRNHVTTSIAMVNPSTVRIDATTGKSACFGDSGGPAYAWVAGEKRVVGVASTADQYCQTVANYARVSNVYAEFIAPLLPPGGGGVCTSSSGPSATTSSSSGGGGSESSGAGGSDSSGAGGESATTGAGETTSSASGLTTSGGAGGDGGAPGSGGAAGHGGSGAGASPPDFGDMCVPVVLQCSSTGAGGGETGGYGWLALAAAIAWRRRKLG